MASLFDSGFFFFVVFLFIGVNEAVNFTDCGTTVRDLVVSVSNCTDEMKECPFIVNDNVTLSANFISGKIIFS
jgi:hypothetical protein